ncbi:hypothetical protein SAY86_009768 [Trapa natans]|uniref:Uncharacterized protein n=1 Tax=Trapa natans TaxID=22666 RepID=A0AAN7L2A2_TRANT|nr:hypothetical protein SAY86_009768 [Trapa natans]
MLGVLGMDEHRITQLQVSAGGGFAIGDVKPLLEAEELVPMDMACMLPLIYYDDAPFKVAKVVELALSINIIPP